MASASVTQHIDGLPVRLRAPHDLGFLERWGRVVSVLDQQDSGNLCFETESAEGRLFVKYAGARTVRYEGEVRVAVEQARRAAEVYRELAHPSLVRLREVAELGAGVALVSDWVDAVPLGRQYGRAGELAGLSSASRADAVQQLFDFGAFAAGRGWVAVDLYDASLLIDPATGRVTLCDLDSFARAPLRNTMGRMWGSDRFMAPEEYRLGAVLDEVTNVFTLGSLAHTLLGDDVSTSRAAWRGTPEQWAVVERARVANRADRWPSVAALAEAWRAATGSAEDSRAGV